MVASVRSLRIPGKNAVFMASKIPTHAGQNAHDVVQFSAASPQSPV